MTTQNKTSNKTQTAQTNKTALSYADIQKQIAALQAQAAALQQAEYSKNLEYFQKIEYSKLEIMNNEDIIQILGNIQKYYKFQDNRVILNSEGVFIKENKPQKDGNKESGNGRALFHILDNAGSIVDTISAQGPISERFFNYLKESVDSYKDITWENFRKSLKQDNSPSKEDYAKVLCQSNPAKFRMA